MALIGRRHAAPTRHEQRGRVWKFPGVIDRGGMGTGSRRVAGHCGRHRFSDRSGPLGSGRALPRNRLWLPCPPLASRFSRPSLAAPERVSAVDRRLAGVRGCARCLLACGRALAAGIWAGVFAGRTFARRGRDPAAGHVGRSRTPRRQPDREPGWLARCFCHRGANEFGCRRSPLAAGENRMLFAGSAFAPTTTFAAPRTPSHDSGRGTGRHHRPRQFLLRLSRVRSGGGCYSGRRHWLVRRVCACAHSRSHFQPFATSLSLDRGRCRRLVSAAGNFPYSSSPRAESGFRRDPNRMRVGACAGALVLRLMQNVPANLGRMAPTVGFLLLTGIILGVRLLAAVESLPVLAATAAAVGAALGLAWIGSALRPVALFSGLAVGVYAASYFLEFVPGCFGSFQSPAAREFVRQESSVLFAAACIAFAGVGWSIVHAAKPFSSQRIENGAGKGI